MKQIKRIVSLIVSVFACFVLYSQTPDAFQYQAIARDNQGEVIVNQEIGIKISILNDSVDSNAIYTETHSILTNKFGLINLAIGKGNSSNDFTGIDWSEGPYFIKVEMDETGGTDYKLMGISQLLSVPYAKYADRAGTTGLNLSDTSATNELQLLSISNDTIYLEKGGYVKLPDTFLFATRAQRAKNAETAKEAQSLVMEGDDKRLYRVKIDSLGNLYTTLDDSYKKLCGTYEEDMQNHNSCYNSKECLIGTWHFRAFIDTANCIVEYVPDSINGISIVSGNSHYTIPWLRFYENDSLAGESIANMFLKDPWSGTNKMYKITDQNELEFTELSMTAAYEPAFGVKYTRYLLDNIHKFQSFTDTLFLYNKQSKLLFLKK